MASHQRGAGVRSRSFILIAKVCFLFAIIPTICASTIDIQYNIREELPIRTQIGNLRNDSGLNAKYDIGVLYMLTFEYLSSGVETDYFSLEEKSGELKVAQIVDRDTMCPSQETCTIHLKVGVKPSQYFVVINVFINIQDTNDNAPSFPQDRVTYDLSETTSPGLLFPILEAIDPDSPEFGVIGYRMDSGNPKFQFLASDSGDGGFDLSLNLLSNLDRESQDFYQIRIVAFDGGSPPKSGMLTIDINVMDINDNDPHFVNSTYEVILEEGFPADTPIVTVKAVDPDGEENGVINYRFSDRSHRQYGSELSIDSVTGSITSLQPLDYESRSEYRLTVFAQDQGVHSIPVSTEVIIQVTDVNDNKPLITLNADNSPLKVKENSPPDTFVAHISVIDPDFGDNGKIQCSLADHDKFRMIEMYEKEYKIVTNKELDREIEANYNIELQCHDMGSPPQSTSTRIFIEVDDENDHYPQLEQDVYDVSMEENNNINAYILQVRANDPDVGNNGKVRYHLGEGASGINIDRKTGVVTAAVSFDREQEQYFEFMVYATDSGDEPKTSTATVYLTILDLDDQPPRFTQRKFIFNVTENRAIGTEVGILEAGDGDQPENNKFEFSIDAHHSNTDAFSVNSKTGSIVTNRVLDREENDLYIIKVRVSSVDIPQMEDEAFVEIHIDDVNDNSPVIVYPDKRNHTLFLSALAPVDYTVVTVQAYDKDFGLNSKLTYSISEGNEKGEFVINPKTGDILVNADLSSYKNEQIMLVVMVTDGGNPPRISAAKLFVGVNPGYALGTHQDLDDPNRLSNEITLAIILGVVAGVICIIIVIVVTLCLLRRRRSRGKVVKGHKPYWQNDCAQIGSPSVECLRKPDVTTGYMTSSMVSADLGLANEGSEDFMGKDGAAKSDKDADSGCADVSQTSNEGSNEGDNRNGSAPQGSSSILNQKTTAMTSDKNNPDGATFSDWVKSEGKQLSRRGHVYRVSQHNIPKSVRFQEPGVSECTSDSCASCTSLANASMVNSYSHPARVHFVETDVDMLNYRTIPPKRCRNGGAPGSDISRSESGSGISRSESFRNSPIPVVNVMNQSRDNPETGSKTVSPHSRSASIDSGSKSSNTPLINKLITPIPIQHSRIQPKSTGITKSQFADISPKNKASHHGGSSRIRLGPRLPQVTQNGQVIPPAPTTQAPAPPSSQNLQGQNVIALRDWTNTHEYYGNEDGSLV